MAAFTAFFDGRRVFWTADGLFGRPMAFFDGRRLFFMAPPRSIVNYKITKMISPSINLSWSKGYLSGLKKFLNLVCFACTLGLLPFVGVRSADRHLQPNLYLTLGGKTFYLFWVKAPLSQGRAALLCSKTAWLMKMNGLLIFFSFL